MQAIVGTGSEVVERQPVIGLVPVQRWRSGQLVARKILVTLLHVGEWPLMVVQSDWRSREGCWYWHRSYRIQETVSNFPGRAFRVHRDAEASVTDGEPWYATFISSDPEAEPDLCECKGFNSVGHCVHRDGLRWLVGNGHV